MDEGEHLLAKDDKERGDVGAAEDFVELDVQKDAGVPFMGKRALISLQSDWESVPGRKSTHPVQSWIPITRSPMPIPHSNNGKYQYHDEGTCAAMYRTSETFSEGKEKIDEMVKSFENDKVADK